MSNTDVQRTQEDVSADSLMERIKRRFIYGLIFGIVVVIGITLFVDGPALLESLRQFDWRLLPLVILAVVMNYVLRFVKWHLYLRWLDVHNLSLKTSIGIFLAGLSMAITPGKVGEFLKSYLVRRASGAPVAVTAPAVIFERITDGVAMLALASIGLLTVQYGWPVLLGFWIAAVIGILILQNRRLVLGVLGWLERFPVVSKRVKTLETLYESSAVLAQTRKFLGAIGIGVVSWFGECLAFFLILVGLGLPVTINMLIVATFILAIASLLGSVSMLPGGLGATEASVAGLLLLLVSNPIMTTDLAAAATLLVRFATLWFGVLIGLGALLLIERHVQGIEETHAHAFAAESSAD